MTEQRLIDVALLLAQELQEFVDDAVVSSGDENSLPAIMARDAVLVQEQEATIGALRAKNNQLQQKLASRLKQIAQLKARLESEEAHYCRLVEQEREAHLWASELGLLLLEEEAENDDLREKVTKIEKKLSKLWEKV